MNQGAIQYPRDDLHVAVRMGLEPGPGRDRVVVVDDEHAMVRIGAQRVDSGVERVASVQPPDPGLMAVRAAANTHARPQERSRAHIILVQLSLDCSSNIMDRDHRSCQGQYCWNACQDASYP